MSNKFNDGLTGKKVNSAELYTGLYPNKVLAINPTEEELKEIIGDNASKFDTKYEIHNSPILEGTKVRGVNIWLQDKDGVTNPTLMTIDLGDTTAVSSSGSKRIINDKLQTAWSASVETVVDNPKMEWFSHKGIREAKVGEEDYYRFLSAYMKFDTKSEVDFVQYCRDRGISFEEIYEKGNFASLKELVAWGNTDEGEKEPWFITQLWVAKRTDNGFRQEVLNKSETWFRCNQDKVTSYEVNLLKKREEDKKNSGYNLTNRLYTYNFQKFVEEESINGAPSQPAVGIEDAPGEDLSWLN